MKFRVLGVALGVVVGFVAVAAVQAKDAGKGKGTVKSSAEITWKEAGIPGVSNAVVFGDMAKRSSHFYLKYAAGFVAPLHHHSPDHFVTTISGNLVLIVDGKEHSLAPGSFFALTGKKPHAARCDGSEDCVMFVDARGPWDVVLEETTAKK